MTAGTTISLLGCHKVEDVRGVSVGVGLQVVRLVISGTLSNHRTNHFPKNGKFFVFGLGCTLTGIQHTCF